jgi:hypothetical protein
MTREELERENRELRVQVAELQRMLQAERTRSDEIFREKEAAVLKAIELLQGVPNAIRILQKVNGLR